MHVISSYRGNRPTNKQTQPQTHTQTGPITIHFAAASTQCNKLALQAYTSTSARSLFKGESPKRYNAIAGVRLVDVEA